MACNNPGEFKRGVDDGNGACDVCASNCKTCDSSTECDVCLTNFYLTTAGKCDLCNAAGFLKEGRSNGSVLAQLVQTVANRVHQKLNVLDAIPIIISVLINSALFVLDKGKQSLALVMEQDPV